jgi:molecular chaperone GrpE
MSQPETKSNVNEQPRGHGHEENGAKLKPGEAPAVVGDAQISAAENAELEQLRADLEAARDGMLRARADLDNYQKRVARERVEERRFAAAALIRDLLGVRDNLQRAVQAAESGGEASALLEGVKLVVQQFTSVLEQHSCKEMPVAPGASFDPNRHEAVSKLPSSEFAEGLISAVIRPGFQVHDRVIRPAQVIVSSGPASQETGARSQESGVRSQESG